LSRCGDGAVFELVYSGYAEVLQGCSAWRDDVHLCLHLHLIIINLYLYLYIYITDSTISHHHHSPPLVTPPRGQRGVDPPM
jgi:hypothetical protein